MVPGMELPAVSVILFVVIVEIAIGSLKAMSMRSVAGTFVVIA
jgi:hypothetical protein